MVADGAISHRKDYVTIFKETKRYGPLHRPTSSSCGGLRPAAKAFFRAKKRAYYAVLAHFRPFSMSSSNLGNWMSVHTQFGHGRTRLSVCAHFRYGRTNLRKSQKVFVSHKKNLEKKKPMKKKLFP